MNIIPSSSSIKTHVLWKKSKIGYMLYLGSRRTPNSKNPVRKQSDGLYHCSVSGCTESYRRLDLYLTHRLRRHDAKQTNGMYYGSSYPCEKKFGCLDEFATHWLAHEVKCKKCTHKSTYVGSFKRHLKITCVPNMFYNDENHDWEQYLEVVFAYKVSGEDEDKIVIGMIK